MQKPITKPLKIRIRFLASRHSPDNSKIDIVLLERGATNSAKTVFTRYTINVLKCKPGVAPDNDTASIVFSVA